MSGNPKPIADRERELYPIDEARARLGGISQAHFYALVSRGVIRLTKLGRRSFVEAAELRRVAKGRAA